MNFVKITVWLLVFALFMPEVTRAADSPATLTNFTASATQTERGKGVQVAVSLVANKALVKAGNIRLMVKDPSGTQLAVFTKDFATVKVGDTVIAGGLFTPTIAHAIGPYKLEATAWSPELNIWNMKQVAFTVVPGRQEAKITYQASDVLVSNKTPKVGETLTYGINITPGRIVPTAGFVELKFQSAAGRVVDSTIINFLKIDARSTPFSKSFVIPASLPAGTYYAIANVWSPELAFYKTGTMPVTITGASAGVQTAITGFTTSLSQVDRGRSVHLTTSFKAGSSNLTKSGYIRLILKNPAGVKIAVYEQPFASVNAGGVVTAKGDFTPTANNALGRYRLEADLWSPEVNLWAMKENAFEVKDAPKTGPVAVCGSANNTVVASAPTANLCGYGAASAVTLVGNSYNWTCADTASNTKSACSAAYEAPKPIVSNTRVKLASFTYGGPDVVKDVQQFDNWLGRKTDLYVTNLNQNSWMAMLQSISWVASPKYYPADRRMVIGVPLTVAEESGGNFWANDLEYKNTNMPKGTLKQVADGAYDQMFRDTALALVKYGRGNAVIRLGWEMNGNWQPWRAAADPENFKKAFQRAVGIFRATPGAKFEFDFCPSFGKQEISPESVYPGDAYVDYIGQDVYDNTWNAYDKDPVVRWDKYYYNAPFGIKWLIDFSKAHGKPMSFPEFGAGGGMAAPGVGDSPYFITKMAEVIKGNNVAYAGYWDSDLAYAGELSTNRYPKIGAEFIRQFRDLK